MMDYDGINNASNYSKAFTGRHVCKSAITIINAHPYRFFRGAETTFFVKFGGDGGECLRRLHCGQLVLDEKRAVCCMFGQVFRDAFAKDGGQIRSRRGRFKAFSTDGEEWRHGETCDNTRLKRQGPQGLIL